MPVYQITSFRGGLSDYEDKGTPGSFKWGANLDIRKLVDSISAGQALVDIGNIYSTSASISPSASYSPSSSMSPSVSASISPSSSVSPSIHISPSASRSPSSSASPSASNSPSGSISPSSSVSSSPSPSAGLHTVFSDLIKWFVPSSDGNMYGFGDAGKVYKITPTLAVFQVYDLRKRITGAIEKPSFGGATYLEFATASELHRKLIPGNSNWDDVDAPGSVQGDTWPKNNLTSSINHMMAIIGGDNLIANGNYLAMSAYDDSYTNEALDLIPGNLAMTLLERVGRAVIGTSPVSDPTGGVNGMVDCEVPLAQIGTQGDIYYADFTNSIAVKRLPGGGKVNPGGMTNQSAQVAIFDWEQTALSWIDKQLVSNMGLMAFYGCTTGKGGLYTAGRRMKNHPFTFNCEYQLDADELGATISWQNNTFVSYRIGSGYGVKVTDQNNKATGIYEGIDFHAPIKTPLNITKWDWAELFFKPLDAGTSIQFWYKLDKNGTFIQAPLATPTANPPTSFIGSGINIGKQRAVFRIGAKGDIFEPRVVVVPYGNLTPEVYRIKLGFV